MRKETTENKSLFKLNNDELMDKLYEILVKENVNLNNNNLGLVLGIIDLKLNPDKYEG